MNTLYKVERKTELFPSLENYLDRALTYNLYNLSVKDKVIALPEDIIMVLDIFLLSKKYLLNYSKKLDKNTKDKNMLIFLSIHNKIAKVLTSSNNVGWIHFTLLESV